MTSLTKLVNKEAPTKTKEFQSPIYLRLKRYKISKTTDQNGRDKMKSNLDPPDETPQIL